jgi:type I restriction enzyme R subunit
LEKRVSIPQVKARLDLIKAIQTDAFWKDSNILGLEKIRQELRELMKFLDDESGHSIVTTTLTDLILESKDGLNLSPIGTYEFEDYKKKVNRYVSEHGNVAAIHKLTHNIPLKSEDYEELERVLTQELGSQEDYKREFGDTPFGLMIRKIAKLDHAAVEQAFANFINDQSLNQSQIVFVRKVIAYVEQNGYMEDQEIAQSPFNYPFSFVKLFSTEQQRGLMFIIRQIKNNALVVTAQRDAR